MGSGSDIDIDDEGDSDEDMNLPPGPGLRMKQPPPDDDSEDFWAIATLHQAERTKCLDARKQLTPLLERSHPSLNFVIMLDVILFFACQLWWLGHIMYLWESRVIHTLIIHFPWHHTPKIVVCCHCQWLLDLFCYHRWLSMYFENTEEFTVQVNNISQMSHILMLSDVINYYML